MNEGDWSVSEMCAADRLYGKYLTACEERYGCSTERFEGASSIISMLEDKAGGEPATASEIAAVRCVVESCAVVIRPRPEARSSAFFSLSISDE